MKPIAKTIRIITIPPISAFLLNIIIYFAVPGSFDHLWELFLIILVTGLIPVLAYPVQLKTHVIRETSERDGQRKLAIILSMVSYSIGLFITIFLHLTYMQTLIYLTYFFSGVLMVLFNLILHIRASGHLCGISGPIAVLIYSLGFQYIFLLGIIFLVIWASIYLKRHIYSEMIVGAIIPIVSMFLSLGILALLY